MTKKQKRWMRRILLAAALFAAAALGVHFGHLPAPAAALCYLVPYLVIGHDVLRKAALGVVHGEVFDENFLMAVATVGAFALGEWGEGVAVMLFYQLGEWFQSYAVGKSRRSIAGLMDIRPDSANLENDDGTVRTVSPEEVPVGAVILVRPGEKIPLDGVVTEGESTLNTAALTGESRPWSARAGEAVISGSVNGDGVLRVRVEKPYAQSTVARILDLVENSSLKKARAEQFITKFARYYTPAVCLGALALAVIPPLVLGGGWGLWISRALTFLVISCPCALVISIPLTFFGGIGGASRCGILVKGGNYLETLAHAGTVVFDKTGTLTRGVFAVSRVRPAPGHTEAEVLALAAAAESFSSHPISKSLREACPDAPRAENAKERTGRGVEALVEGRRVLAGSARLMQEEGIGFVPDDGVGTVVYLACEGAFLGSVLIADEVKPGAAAAMAELRRAGARTVMLTGDAEAVAAGTARELGLDEYHAELLPADKVERVEALMQRPGTGKLAFVGDGINDAPVLMRADVGVAMGALGSDAAIEAADVVLMDDDPAKVALAIRLARRCMGIVYQNIVFALGIKGLFLILGAVGIANMWWAVFADVGVMVLAVLNAMRMLSVRALRR